MAWKRCRLSLNDTMRHALEIISEGSMQIGVVTDSSDTLIGIITDGDIRRELLKGATLDDDLLTIVNTNPITGEFGSEKNTLLNLMREKKIQSLPLVDKENKIRDIISVNDFVFNEKRNNIVVLMAGGLGTRLHPLTDCCPKPLLKVGEKPILEIILDSFIDAGFYRFFIAVNYKSQMIEDYFGNGEKYGIEISYLREKKRMGTAGALYMLPSDIGEPIIVMNGDLLTKVDFCAMLDSHIISGAQATMAIREYTYQIPYGVIDFDGSSITGINEKPAYEFFVSAGIYVLSPETVARVNQEVFLDMPDLFKNVLNDHGKINGYPIRDYWLDIGRMDDFTKAQEEYGNLFNS